MVPLPFYAPPPPPPLPPTDEEDPRVAILLNPAALGALKRAQLVSLCKSWGIKAVGKNLELAAKLHAHGQLLAAGPGPMPHSPTPDSGPNADWSIVSASAVAAAMEVDGGETSEFGVGAGASNTTSSKSSSLRTKGNSLAKRIGDTLRGQAGPSTSAASKASPVPTPKVVLPGSFTFAQPPPPSPSFASSDDDEPPAIRLVDSPHRTVTTSSPYQHSPSSSPMKPSARGATISNSPFGRPSWLPHCDAPQPASTVGSPAMRRIASPPARRSVLPGSFVLDESNVFVFGTSQAAGKTFAFGAMGDVGPKVVDKPAVEGLTAAQLVIKEMNDRVAAARGATVVVGADGLAMATVGEWRGKGFEKEKEKMDAFSGKHKRVFDKMDSISSHYAAKRVAPPAQHAAVAGPSVKRLKTSATTATGTHTTTNTHSYTTSSRAVSRSPEKKLVAALRDDGWTAPTTTVGSTRGLGKPKIAFGSGPLAREGLKSGEDEERERKKRAMELAKARRASGVMAGVGAGGRRMSLVVGRQPKMGNAASRFLKTTMKKLGGSSSAAPPPLPVPSTSTSTATARPLPRTTSFTFGGPSPSLVKKEPGWKKFDLQASLSRPLSYVPRKGPIASLAAASPSGSMVSRSTSLSRLPHPSPSVSSTRPAPPAPISSLRRAAPSGSLSRRPSARVANPSLLGAVKSDPAPVPELDEPLDEAAKEDIVMNLFHPIDALSAPSADLPVAPPTLFADFGAGPSGTAKGVLGGGGAGSPPKSPFRPTTKSSPAKGPGLGGAGRKVVSSTSRAARDLGKGKGVEGLETRARMVKARKSAAPEGKAKVARP